MTTFVAPGAAESTHGLIFSNSPKIKVGGATLGDGLLNKLVTLDVDLVLNRPDLCVLTFLFDQSPDATDGSTQLAPGKALAVSMKSGTEQGADVPIFDGEITAVELHGSEHSMLQLVVVANDKRHRLYRKGKNATYIDVSLSDLFSKVVREAGLTSQADGLPSTIYPWLLQQNESSGDFLERVLRPFAIVLLWDNGKVVAKPLNKLTTSPIAALQFNVDVLSFRCADTSDGDLPSATVRGWDPKQKKEIVGNGTRSEGAPSGVLAGSAVSEFSPDPVLDTDLSSLSQADAHELAKAIVAEQLDGLRQMEAICLGHPELKAGHVVELKGAIARFNGKYRLSTVRHTFTLEEGFRTHLASHGAKDGSLAGMVQDAAAAADAVRPYAPGGVYPAIVTKVKPDSGKGIADAGMVKVKLPWLGDQIESGHLRVVFPGAGAKRGLFMLPEVGDEVLVAFIGNDFTDGFVLGGLYNGKDSAPIAEGTAIDGSNKIQQRVFQSRTGHQVLFDDTDGKGKVIIKSGSKKLSITLDEQNDKIVIDSDGDVEVTAAKTMTFKATSDLSIEGKNVTIKAQQNLDMEATSKATLKGTAGADIDGGPMTNVKSSGKLTLDGGGMAELKGGLVKIN